VNGSTGTKEFYVASRSADPLGTFIKSPRSAVEIVGKEAAMGLATSTAEQAAHITKDAAEQIRSGGEAVYESARREAERIAAERRDGMATFFHDIAEAMSSASETLQNRNRPSAAEFARSVAQKIDTVGGRVEGEDIDRVLRRLEQFARSRPILFFGAAGAAGFLIVQLFLRSSGTTGSAVREIPGSEHSEGMA
jgi:hypothetical protein